MNKSTAITAACALAGSLLTATTTQVNAATTPAPAQRATVLTGVTPPGARRPSTRVPAPSLAWIKSCQSGLERIDAAGSWTSYVYSAGELRTRPWGLVKFDGVAQKPRLMTFVARDDHGQPQWIAILPDGTLWLVTMVLSEDMQTATPVTTKLGAGYGDVRSMAGNEERVFYMLRGGTLQRGVVDEKGVLTGPTVIGTAGWSTVTAIGYAGWGEPRQAADPILGVRTSGGLTEYAMTAAGARTTAQLATTGYAGYVTISQGMCWSRTDSSLEPDPARDGRTITGVTSTGTWVGYLDRNGRDKRGTDIQRAGQIATGLTGLTFN